MVLKIEDDKLNRSQELKKLFKLFNNFGDQNGHGITMLINGKYGSGKTTLLNFIEEQAINENANLHTIRLNIWEEKLFDNPLLSLIHKISELESKIMKTTKEIKGRGKKIVSSVLKESVLKLFKLFTKIDLKSLGVSKEDLDNDANILDEYQNYNDAIQEYRQALTNFCAEKKVILLIDELDRCLPEYQIKTLEVLHHFFDVPNLIVVIAMDKTQLEYSIQNIFGDSIDIVGYLNKFINYEVQLPKGTTETYIFSLLGKIKLPQEHKQDIFFHDITNILIPLDLSLRDLQRVINEIALIYNERLSNNELQVLKYAFFSRNVNTALYPDVILDPVLIALLVILKNYRKEFYNKYFMNQNRKLSNEQLDLLDSASVFKQFLDEIEQDIFKNSIQDSISSISDKYFLLNLINLICPIRNINFETILEYWKRLQNNYNDVYGKEVFLLELAQKLSNNTHDIRNMLIDKINLL